MTISFRCRASAACVLLTIPLIARGQTRCTAPRRKSPGKTIVSVVLITTDNAAGLQARQWTRALTKLDVNLRIRRGTSADKPGIIEVKQGDFRKVTVTGKLDRTGRLIFKDRVFKRGDDAKFGEWVRELKTYGGQGAPAGKPLWGLSKTQFGKVYAALTKPVAKDVHGASLDAALTGLGLPADYPVRYSVAGKKAAAGATQTVRKHVSGQSLGTSLALVLRDYGLGFRPFRTPSGDIELVIDPLSIARDAWPIGWDLKASRPKTAPKMFQLIVVDLEKTKLTDLFTAVAAKTGVPIHVDFLAAKAKGIDVDKIVVSYPRRKSSYSLLLKSVTVRNKLSRKLRIDEAGKPFVWVTAFGASKSR